MNKLSKPIALFDIESTGGDVAKDRIVELHKMNPRDLSSAVKHYLGFDMQKAHSAEADINATLGVFTEQIKVHFKDQADAFDQYARICKDPNVVDFAGRLLRNESGLICYTFGKHKGKAVKENYETAQYADWLLSQDFITQDTKWWLREELGRNPKPSPAVEKNIEVAPVAEVNSDDEFPI